MKCELRLHSPDFATSGALLTCRPFRAYQNKMSLGDQHVFSRIAIVTALVAAVAGAGAVAVDALHVPDPSIYVLLAAGIVALVMLRRRAS